MSEVQVENILFGFDHQWEVMEKWDDTWVFRDGIRKLNGEVWDDAV